MSSPFTDTGTPSAHGFSTRALGGFFCLPITTDTQLFKSRPSLGPDGTGRLLAVNQQSK